MILECQVEVADGLWKRMDDAKKSGPTKVRVMHIIFGKFKAKYDLLERSAQSKIKIRPIA